MILKQVKDAAPPDLAKAVRVNKRWNAVGTDLLCRDMVLDLQSITPFVDSCPAQKGAKVRSCTVYLNLISKNVGPWICECVSCSALRQGGRSREYIDLEAATQGLWGSLQGMTSLASFSLHINHLVNFNAVQNTVNYCLENLPSQCKNLELNVLGRQISCWGTSSPTTHLCETIRDVLPRMNHVRLKLPYICSSIFGRVPVDKEKTLENFRPISLLQMKSLMVNCCWVRSCHEDMSHDPCCPTTSQDPVITTWSPITATLNSLVHNKKACSPFAQILVVDEWARCAQTYTTLVRTEIVSRTTQAFPFPYTIAMFHSFQIYNLGRGKAIGREHFLGNWLERHIWMDGKIYERQPAGLLLNGPVTQQRNLEIASSMENQIDGGRCIPPHSRIEYLARMWFNFAETHTGSTEYLANRRIRRDR